MGRARLDETPGLKRRNAEAPWGLSVRKGLSRELPGLAAAPRPGGRSGGGARVSCSNGRDGGAAAAARLGAGAGLGAAAAAGPATSGQVGSARAGPAAWRFPAPALTADRLPAGSAGGGSSWRRTERCGHMWI